MRDTLKHASLNQIKNNILNAYIHSQSESSMLEETSHLNRLYEKKNKLNYKDMTKTCHWNLFQF